MKNCSKVVFLNLLLALASFWISLLPSASLPFPTALSPCLMPWFSIYEILLCDFPLGISWRPQESIYLWLRNTNQLGLAQPLVHHKCSLNDDHYYYSESVKDEFLNKKKVFKKGQPEVAYKNSKWWEREESLMGKLGSWWLKEVIGQ